MRDKKSATFSIRSFLRKAGRVKKEYFEKINAPVKGFYTFENSAHSPIFEEPERSLKILREDVLAGTNTLADTK